MHRIKDIGPARAEDLKALFHLGLHFLRCPKRQTSLGIGTAAPSRIGLKSCSQYRLEVSHSLLEDKELNITDIAFLCGFSQISYLPNNSGKCMGIRRARIGVKKQTVPHDAGIVCFLFTFLLRSFCQLFF